MLVTINTDASFYHSEKSGGFAFWIVSDYFRIKCSGALKNVENSTDAETQCIANALTVLLNSKANNVHKVIINTDSKHSIIAIKTHFSKTAKGIKAIKHCREIMKKLKEKHGKELDDSFFDFRYVAAHTGIKDSRSIVNEWCDNKAKEWARKVKNGNINPINNNRTSFHK